jgi:hypothetical protein
MHRLIVITQCEDIGVLVRVSLDSNSMETAGYMQTLMLDINRSDEDAGSAETTCGFPAHLNMTVLLGDREDAFTDVLAWQVFRRLLTTTLLAASPNVGPSSEDLLVPPKPLLLGVGIKEESVKTRESLLQILDALDLIRVW